MTSLIGVGVKSGFQIIKYYFCKNLDRGDYTNEQILDVFENKLTSISKDLEDLKLQKLRSATFLVRSGVQVYDANDLEEAMRNFDKAEMDAIEAFSTAPTIDWKVLSIKLAISAHIWRKIVLARDSGVNFESVLKQITLHIQRLLDDGGVKDNVKTHLKGSIMSSFNKTKRLELISNVLEIENLSRKVLFENFLEMLPVSRIQLSDGSNVSLLSLSNYRENLVPFSPRQCSLFEPIAAIKSWRNLSCSIEADINKANEMLACGSDFNGSDAYITQRKWIDLHSTIKKCCTSVNVFEMTYPGTYLTNQETADATDSKDFEVTFISLKAFIQNSSKQSPMFDLSLQNKHSINATNISVKQFSGLNQEHCMLFYRGSDLVKMLNQSMSDLTVTVCANECDISITTIEVIVHFKSKQYRYTPHCGTSTNTTNLVNDI